MPSILFDRHFYTASRSRDGYFTLAATKTLEKKFVESAIVDSGLIYYRKPDFMAEPTDLAELAHFPASFVFSTVEGKRVFSKIHYTGWCNHTPHRMGNSFADTLLVAEENPICQHYVTPLLVFDNPEITWKISLPREEDENFDPLIKDQQFPFSDTLAQESLKSLVGFIEDANGLEKTGLLLHTILGAVSEDTDKRIVIIAPQKDLTDWMLVATAFFPPELIDSLSFKSYIADLEYSSFFLNGIPAEAGLDKALSATGKYIVLNITEPSDFKIADSPYLYVKEVCKMIKNRNIASILALQRDALETFEADGLNNSLDSVAEFNGLLEKVVPASGISFRSILNMFEVFIQRLGNLGIKRKKNLKDRLFEEASLKNPASLDEYYKLELKEQGIVQAAENIVGLYNNGYLVYLNRSDYPAEFLRYSLNWAFKTLGANEDKTIFVKLTWRLLQSLDLERIDTKIIDDLCKISIALLEPQPTETISQKEVFEKLRAIEKKFQLRLEDEPLFKLWEIKEAVEEERSDALHMIRDCFREFADRFKNMQASLRNKCFFELLSCRFKIKKTSKPDGNEWKQIIELIKKIPGGENLPLLTTYVLTKNGSDKYFIRGLITNSTKFYEESRDWEDQLRILLKEPLIMKYLNIEQFREDLWGYSEFDESIAIFLEKVFDSLSRSAGRF